MNDPLRSSDRAGLVAALGLWPRQGLQALVRGYRFWFKPWLGNACRFEPSCSSYALQALQRHGAVAGTALTGWRLLRCQPWCEGGCDPVPAQLFGPRQHAVAGRFTASFTGLFTGLLHRTDLEPQSSSGPQHHAAEVGLTQATPAPQNPAQNPQQHPAQNPP
jgi:uncharacterized protein